MKYMNTLIFWSIWIFQSIFQSRRGTLLSFLCPWATALTIPNVLLSHALHHLPHGHSFLQCNKLHHVPECHLSPLLSTNTIHCLAHCIHGPIQSEHLVPLQLRFPLKLSPSSKHPHCVCVFLKWFLLPEDLSQPPTLLLPESYHLVPKFLLCGFFHSPVLIWFCLPLWLAQYLLWFQWWHFSSSYVKS